jgi:hypothetical protein
MEIGVRGPLIQNKQHVETWGELGPAMRALPNDRWRAFVMAYVTGKPGLGAITRAAKLAGFGGKGGTSEHLRKQAWALSRDDRMIAAIAEEAKKVIRLGAPEAAAALLNLVRTPDHRDHARGVAMLLDRVDPTVSMHDVQVLHKVVDADEEALEELRAVRQLGATREKLLSLFGYNGLERLEALEARRAAAARVIDGEVTEVADG